MTTRKQSVRQIHPCLCNGFNGRQCCNCLNGFHSGCRAGNCKAKDAKQPGLRIVVKAYER